MENSAQPLKWYFKTGPLIIIFGCVGPLALPLVWWHPRFKPITKIALTIIILFLTYYLGIMFYVSLESLDKYSQQLQENLNLLNGQ